MKKDKKMQNGLAAQYRVASELILRNINPYFASIDTGVDFVLENGIRLQVKSSEGYLPKDQKVLRWIFHLSSVKWNKSQKSQEYDYLILWKLRTDDFYIIPYPEIEKLSVGVKQKKINMSKETESKLKKFLNRWDLLVRE